MSGWVSVLRVGISGLLLAGSVGCTSLSGSGGSEDSELDAETGVGTTLPHPSNASAEATKILLAAHGAEVAEGVADCRSQIEAIGSRATSEGTMMAALEDILPAVEKDQEGFHWCFFATAADLDRQLDNSTLNLEQKAEKFLVTYRALWPLAKALDQMMEDEGYFSYLQKRYLSISAEYFGRELEPSGPGFQERSKTEKKKPAGYFKEN